MLPGIGEGRLRLDQPGPPLRPPQGDAIEGFCRPPAPPRSFRRSSDRHRVGHGPPEVARERPRFEDLTPLFPDERLHLEMPGEKEDMTARIVDLLSPIGKGQRGLIVSPRRPARRRS